MTGINGGILNRFRNFACLSCLLFVIWLMLTSSLHWQEVSVGAILSIALALPLHRKYIELGLPPFGGRRIAYSAIYILVLFKEIILANIDVAYRVVHPGMPINPGIVVIRTSLKSNIAKLILANSITLTPGTFTVDIQDDRLLIHWINVKSPETEKATEVIGERFEKYLRVIFR